MKKHTQNHAPINPETWQPGEPSKKYLRDKATFDAIMSKGTANLDHFDRLALIGIYGASYHDSGKIAGATSCDGSCSHCGFCQRMREAAKSDEMIICGRCYDWTQEHSYKGTNVYYRHGLNQDIMTAVLFEVEELATMPTTEIVRINSSGDLDNVIQARNMIRIAKAKPWAKVALWTKNLPAIETALQLEGGKPLNLVIIISSARINHPVKRPTWADYTFTVYTKDRIDEAISRGAMECNGKKCAACGWKCYLRTWPAGANIAEVLK